MKVNIDRDKLYDVEIDKLKYLMETFFLEGFPFYDSSSKDLSNLFDSDEENSP